MRHGNSNKNKRWSCKLFWRDNERMRCLFRTATGPSGVTWRRDTRRKRGNCSGPRRPPTPDPPSTTCGPSRSPPTPTHTRAAGTVPGRRRPPQTCRPPAGPSRTPGHLPMGTGATGANWTTGTPNIRYYCWLLTPSKEAFLYTPGRFKFSLDNSLIQKYFGTFHRLLLQYVNFFYNE